MKRALVMTLHGIDVPATLPPDFYRVADGRYMLQAEIFDTLLDAATSLNLLTITEARKSESPRCTILTFDDGLLSDYLVALPRLRMKKASATFFVNPANLDKRGYISSQQLSEMHAEGMEIGSHGMTHRKLVCLSSREAQTEIEDSKDALEDMLQAPVTSFAPVGGHYRRWMLDVAQNAGYQAFASMSPGWTNLGTDQFLFRRNHIQSRHSAEKIAAILRGDRMPLAGSKLKYIVLNFARRALGMRSYDAVRKWLLSGVHDSSHLA